MNIVGGFHLKNWKLFDTACLNWLSCFDHLATSKLNIKECCIYTDGVQCENAWRGNIGHTCLGFHDRCDKKLDCFHLLSPCPRNQSQAQPMSMLRKVLHIIFCQCKYCFRASSKTTKFRNDSNKKVIKEERSQFCRDSFSPCVFEFSTRNFLTLKRWNAVTTINTVIKRSCKCLFSGTQQVGSFSLLFKSNENGSSCFQLFFDLSTDRSIVYWVRGGATTFGMTTLCVTTLHNNRTEDLYYVRVEI